MTVVAVNEPEDKTLPTTWQGKLAPNYYCRGWNAKQEKYCAARAGTGTDHVGFGRCKFHNGNAETIHGLRRRYQFNTPRLQDMLEKHEADENPLDIRKEIDLLRTLAEDYVDRYESRVEELSAWHAQRRLDPDQMSAMYRVLDEFEAVTDRTDAQGEMLALARAAVSHLGEDIPRPRNIPDIAAASSIVAEITKAVERVFNMRAKNAITYDQLRRFLFAAERYIEGRVRSAIPDADAADKVIEKIGEDLRGIRP